MSITRGLAQFSIYLKFQEEYAWMSKFLISPWMSPEFVHDIEFRVEASSRDLDSSHKNSVGPFFYYYKHVYIRYYIYNKL